MSLVRGAAENPAFVNIDGTQLRYRGLRRALSPWHKVLEMPGKRLVLLFAENSLDTFLCYLACVESGHALMLADPRLGAPAVSRVLSAFEPDLVVRPGPSAPPPEGYLADGPLWRRRRGDMNPVHDEIAVLMMTSGSTGAPRVVCLSQKNLSSNADSIAQALGITESDRAITSLPPHYCYGLSVLNSHLARGASIVLTTASPTGKAFMRNLADTRATSLAGVPLTHRALWPILSREWPPALRSLTSAGGKLDNVEGYAGLTTSRKGRFFVMYGQTEATARMAVLDTTAHPEFIGSVGTAIPHGSFEILGSGEIVYRGPNVMLGYADTRADLMLGDRTGGVLHTGDTGSIRDGFLFLNGRLKRIAKIGGRRISLDEVEGVFQALGAAAVIESEGRMTVFSLAEPGPARRLAGKICAELAVPPAYLRVKLIDELPVGATGKIDYQALSSDP